MFLRQPNLSNKKIYTNVITKYLIRHATIQLIRATIQLIDSSSSKSSMI